MKYGYDWEGIIPPTEKELEAIKKRRRKRINQRLEVLTIFDNKLTRREQAKVVAYFKGFTQVLAREWLQKMRGD
jgi:hypothetical protein